MLIFSSVVNVIYFTGFNKEDGKILLIFETNCQKQGKETVCTDPSLTQDWSSADYKNKHLHFPHKYARTPHRHSSRKAGAKWRSGGVSTSTSSNPTGNGGRSQRELKTSSWRYRLPARSREITAFHCQESSQFLVSLANN